MQVKYCILEGTIFNWSKQNELFLLRKIAHIFVAIRFCAIPEGRQSGINFIGYFKSDMIQLNLPLSFCFLSDQAEIGDLVVRTGKFQFKWALALKHEDIGIEHLSTCIILLIVIVSRHTWNVYNSNMKKKIKLRGWWNFFKVKVKVLITFWLNFDILGRI